MAAVKPIRFKYQDDDGYSFTKKTPFEGVIPNLERRYHETESELVREELRKYIAVRTCETCRGTRLNKSARNVFVAIKTYQKLRHGRWTNRRHFLKN